MVDLSSMDDLKKSILKDSERLTETDTFGFSCRPDLPCYNKCCADVNIVLTPYDVIRLKNRLGVSSEEFLEKYCLVARSATQRLPVVLLRMREDETKSCQFVGEKGCSVYEDRPWPCRMFPVGVASPRDDIPGAEKDSSQSNEKFYFILKEKICEGLREKKQWTIRDWIKDQGADQYEGPGELFKEISLHPGILKPDGLDPAKMEMLHMVLYNLDKFRRFVFESTFLKRYVIDGETLEKIRTDDVELMKFGFRWLRYCVFGEGEFEITPAARKALVGTEKSDS